MFVNFHYLSKETKENIYRYIRYNNLIKIAFDTLGKQEMYFLATVHDPMELNALIKDIKGRFHDAILDVDHILITRELKLDFFPKALEAL